MGQLERYGLYVLCLVIFLILGVAIWGDDGSAAVKDLNANVGKNDGKAEEEKPLETEEQKLAKFESFLREQKQDTLQKQKAAESLFETAEEGSEEKSTGDAGKTPPSPPTPVELTHTVQGGDNLESIAKRYLGKRHLWRKILAANPNVDERNLRLGSVLKIPVLEANTGAAGPAKRVRSAPSGRTYRVRRGDSAWSIAKKHYGERKASDYAKRILKLNAISDAGALKPGTRIQLPQ